VSLFSKFDNEGIEELEEFPPGGTEEKYDGYIGFISPNLASAETAEKIRRDSFIYEGR